jgi:hypothetical protein
MKDKSDTLESCLGRPLRRNLVFEGLSEIRLEAIHEVTLDIATYR